MLHLKLFTTGSQSSVKMEEQPKKLTRTATSDEDCDEIIVEHNPLHAMTESAFTRPKRKASRDDSPEDMEIDEIKNFNFSFPRANSPEKIIICLDASSEMEDTHFRHIDGASRSYLNAAKHSLTSFIYTKHEMNHRHEFALVLLRDTAIWLGDFTNDPRVIIELLTDVADTATCDSMQMSTLFNAIMEKVRLPEVSLPEVTPPEYIIRAILIYGRSTCIPEYDFNLLAQKELLVSKYFFFDVIYLRNKKLSGTKSELIFDSFREMNAEGFWYIQELDGGDVNRLDNLMAKYLAHPLQRPLQKQCHYKLVPR